MSMRSLPPALFLSLSVNASAVEIRVASFNVGAHFGEEYFDYGLGDASTPDHQSVRAILARIGADVVALQEIHSADVAGSPNDLDDLAAFLGYPHVHVAGTSGAFDNTFRVVILSRFPFLTEGDIQSPAGAREISRLHPVVKVDVPGTTRDPVIVSTHLKSETGLAERFRRAVEMKRLVGHLETAGLTDDDNFIILGDFNPSSDDHTFSTLPSGLPGSYVLGSDITFPVSYSTDPLAYFSSPGTARLDARQLDQSASTYGTESPGGPTLDLILISPAIARRPARSEVYNSALDLTNDAGMEKSGVPLADSTSAAASDHHAVFADVNLDDAGPYAFTAPGQTVAEDFTGFAGNNDPAPWTTHGEAAWNGIDDGSSGGPGLRSYGMAADGSLGFLGGGGGTSMTGEFANQSAVSLTAMRISIDIEQWRSAMNGTADVIHAGLVTDTGTIPLPGLSFAASQSLPSGAVAGGVSNTLETTVTGLSIPPGGAFGLRVAFVPGAGGGVAPDDVFVNEFHYDNEGTDAGEFVEIAVAPGFSGALSDISLVTYNGSNGAANGTHALDAFTPGETTVSGHRLFHRAIPGLQNDAEGFAVAVGPTALHFISYEGSFTATSGPAAGMISTDIGVSQTTTEVIGETALGLTGTGGSAADFTWTKFSGSAHSPGQPNPDQTFVMPALASQGLAIDNLSMTFLTDNDLDGQPDETDPDDDNDGQSDAFEAAFGTDRLDAGSRFVTVLTRNNGLELTFPGALGVRYAVEISGNLTSWQEHSVHIGNGGVVVVPLPAVGQEMFFRVRAGD